MQNANLNDEEEDFYDFQLVKARDSFDSNQRRMLSDCLICDSFTFLIFQKQTKNSPIFERFSWKTIKSFFYAAKRKSLEKCVLLLWKIKN